MNTQLNEFEKELLNESEKRKLQSYLHIAQADVQEFRFQIQSLSVDKKEAAYTLFLTKLTEIRELHNDLKTTYLITFKDVQVPLILKKKIDTIRSTTDLQSRYPIVFQYAFILGLVLGLLSLLLDGANKAWFKWTDETYGLAEFWIALELIIFTFLGKVCYWKWGLKYTPIFIQSKRLK